MQVFYCLADGGIVDGKVGDGFLMGVVLLGEGWVDSGIFHNPLSARCPFRSEVLVVGSVMVTVVESKMA